VDELKDPYPEEAILQAQAKLNSPDKGPETFFTFNGPESPSIKLSAEDAAVVEKSNSSEKN
jgi:hypothetical protein